MKNVSICSICEEGNLLEHIGVNAVEYKGNKKKLPLHYSECNCCGSEISTATQSRTNKRLMTEFKKQVDGLLTGKKLKELRLTLGLTQADAAQVFGGGPVAFAKYEADDVAQSEAMDKLLRVALAVPEAYKHLTNNSSYTNRKILVIHDVESHWKTFVPEHKKPKHYKLEQKLRVISSKPLNQGQGYTELRAVS